MRDYASLYQDLLADLELSGVPWSHFLTDMTPLEAAKVSLAHSFYKKLCPLGNTKLADTAALNLFLSINAGLPGPEWSFGASNEAESCFYDYFKDNLRVALEPHESFGSFDLGYIREHMGVGPGAAQKADSSHMVSKLFESPMSYVNPDLISVYRTALSETGFWANAEMQRFQKYGFVRVRGGKIFFAPKKAEISRTCCTEASLNMLIQKACGEFIEDRLVRYFGINLSTQPGYNRELARIGSLTGAIGTIDLASASDSVMLQLCVDALPNGFLKSIMMMSRCRFATLPNGDEVELKMMSTMGNGFTFPLQTLIFACAVRAVYQLMDLPCRCPRTEFGVFGDDICVRKETYEFVIAMLAKLGFKVNVGKSFNSGPFRESCGHDYFDGLNIRGVYVRSLETPQHVYSIVNRLLRWSAFHGIQLTRTLRTLKTWARDVRVPPSESDDAGFHVPFKLSKPVVDNRYWFQYRYYKRRVKKQLIDEPEDSDEVPSVDDGAAVGFLAGVYRRRDFLLTNPDDSAWKHDWSVSVSIRDKKGARARYQIAHKSIPWWDYLPDTTTEEHLPWEYEWRVPLTRYSYSAWESRAAALFSEF